MIVFWLLTPIMMLKFKIFLIPNFNFWGVPSSFQGIVRAWVYAGVCKCVLVYTDMRKCTGVCNGVRVCMWDDFSDKVPYTNHVDDFLDFFYPLPPSTAIPSLYWQEKKFHTILRMNSLNTFPRQPFFFETKKKYWGLLEGWWYTCRNLHQIWAELAVWARW